MNFDMRPEFFKIISNGVTSERLKIPPKFLKHISNEVSDRVILKGPSGRRWHAKLSNEEGFLYIEDGWQKFMSDHSLGDYEFLIFRYDGNICFNVQIFDKSGCERVNASIISLDSAALEERRKPGRPRKKQVGSRHTHSFRVHKDSPELSKCFQRKRHSAKDEIGNEVERAECFTSKFPHFMTRLSNASATKSFQAIPIAFARPNLPPSKTCIIIQNSEGRVWEVTCIYNDGKRAFSGGWTAFIRGNKLNVGDVCVFELIDKEKMRVNIFRSRQLHRGNEIIREPNDDPSL